MSKFLLDKSIEDQVDLNDLAIVWTILCGPCESLQKNNYANISRLHQQKYFVLMFKHLHENLKNEEEKPYHLLFLSKLIEGTPSAVYSSHLETVIYFFLILDYPSSAAGLGI